MILLGAIGYLFFAAAFLGVLLTLDNDHSWGRGFLVDVTFAMLWPMTAVVFTVWVIVRNFQKP